ncbi:MAG: hypothetical protein R3D33_05855 [Hyphomicrobiaceae bacterium]
MAQKGRGLNEGFEALMGDVAGQGTASAEAVGSDAELRQGRGSRLGGIGAALAAMTSLVALAFSGYSFYETVLKRAELRVYSPPLVYMYRKDFRDVLAIPVTISNDGAARGTVLSFDLEVTDLDTGETKAFQNLHFGTSPVGDVRMFTPITVAGRSSFSDVVLFHAMKTGAFVETTGGVRLPLRLKLTLNVDATGDWLRPAEPAPLVFDMTASYIAGFNDMEAGRPTELHDARWTGVEGAGAN